MGGLGLIRSSQAPAKDQRMTSLIAVGMGTIILVVQLFCGGSSIKRLSWREDKTIKE